MRRKMKAKFARVLIAFSRSHTQKQKFVIFTIQDGRGKNRA
jgi:hypothetical protein